MPEQLSSRRGLHWISADVRRSPRGSACWTTLAAVTRTARRRADQLRTSAHPLDSVCSAREATNRVEAVSDDLGRRPDQLLLRARELVGRAVRVEPRRLDDWL